MAQLPDNTFELLACVARGRFSTGDLADWAVTALGGGVDSPSLRMLAATHSHDAASEAVRLFDRSLRELGIDIPKGPALLRRYALELAQRVLAGTLAPIEAAKRMCRRVVEPLDYPDDLAVWCAFWHGFDADDLSIIYSEMSESEFATVVRQEARRVVDASA